MNVHQICTRLDTSIHSKIYQISEKSMCEFAFYTGFCKICKENKNQAPQSMIKERKKKFFVS